MTKKQLRLFYKQEPLKTERLTLRKILKTDLEDVYDYAKNPNVSKYLLWSPHPNREYTEKYLEIVEKLYLKAKFYDFAIVLNENSKMIGTVGFTSINIEQNSAEIGYVLNERYWKKGYAREAVLRIIEYAREVLHLDTLYAKFILENERSRNLLTSLGFSQKAELRHGLSVKGEMREICVFSKKISEG